MCNGPYITPLLQRDTVSKSNTCNCISDEVRNRNEIRPVIRTCWRGCRGGSLYAHRQIWLQRGWQERRPMVARGTAAKGVEKNAWFVGDVSGMENTSGSTVRASCGCKNSPGMQSSVEPQYKFSRRAAGVNPPG
ncbi:hypothetical protein RRG08_047101 [Elysia crispata]|uniref:Uncharacterized protein n=1 Tax=Elysia crispata TaxID=231223 RepID=A0AAE1DFK4_9GAST|nr:hypothetical protein RRG08_047101 [Elysia crispata]